MLNYCLIYLRTNVMNDVYIKDGLKMTCLTLYMVAWVGLFPLSRLYTVRDHKPRTSYWHDGGRYTRKV